MLMVSSNEPQAPYWSDCVPFDYLHVCFRGLCLQSLIMVVYEPYGQETKYVKAHHDKGELYDIIVINLQLTTFHLKMVWN